MFQQYPGQQYSTVQAAYYNNRQEQYRGPQYSTVQEAYYNNTGYNNAPSGYSAGPIATVQEDACYYYYNTGYNNAPSGCSAGPVATVQDVYGMPQQQQGPPPAQMPTLPQGY
ncbi:hypothetical protein T484DRAFT_1839986, partial [Baffinella frigidus]